MTNVYRKKNIKPKYHKKMVIINNGSSGFWNDKVCHLCLKFEAMSHGGTERTEDY